MSGGYSYYCPSHESCIESRDLAFVECKFATIPGLKDESPEYLGHTLVGDSAFIADAVRAFKKH